MQNLWIRDFTAYPALLRLPSTKRISRYCSLIYSNFVQDPGVLPVLLQPALHAVSSGNSLPFELVFDSHNHFPTVGGGVFVHDPPVHAVLHSPAVGYSIPFVLHLKVGS